MAPTNIVAKWSTTEVLALSTQNLLKRPTEYPSAFNSIQAPDQLSHLYETSVTNEDFLAKVEISELEDLFTRFCEEYSNDDLQQFAWWDFESDINLMIFARKPFGPVVWHVTKANFGQAGPNTEMVFEANNAEDFIIQLGINLAADIVIQQHGNGLLSVKADRELFVAQDVRDKVNQDLQCMDETTRMKVASKIGSDSDPHILADNLVNWMKEVKYAPY